MNAETCIRELYIRLLHREADASGIKTYSRLLHNGKSIDHVEKIIKSSSEYKSLHSDFSLQTINTLDACTITEVIQLKEATTCTEPPSTCEAAVSTESSVDKASQTDNLSTLSQEIQYTSPTPTGDKVINVFGLVCDNADSLQETFSQLMAIEFCNIFLLQLK